MRRALALLAITALLAACAPAPPERQPSALPRVVSLNPCTDAILAEVADPAQVLAISHYSKDPRATSLPAAVAARYRATRGTVEEVLVLQPDLVLGSTYTDPANAHAYARLGLRLEAFGVAGTVAESRAQVRRIAALVGHPERGDRLVARIDAALARSVPPAGSPAVPTVLWQPGGLVAGQGTLIAELMAHAGLAPAGGPSGAVLSLEELLADPPPLLLLVDDAGASGAAEDRLRFHPAFARLTGIRRERLDARLVFCGGPSVVGALDRLAQVRRTFPAPGAGA